MFYEVKVRGNATNPEDGCIKPAEFNYLVKGAVLFGDAEKAALEHAAMFYNATDISAKAIKLSNVAECFEDENKDKFYRCKIITTIFDGVKEPKTKVIYLVSGNSAVEADQLLKSKMDAGIEFDVSDISETKIGCVLSIEE